MFVDKIFTYLTCAYLKKQKVFYCEIFTILFSYEDQDIGNFQICNSVPLSRFNDTNIAYELYQAAKKFFKGKVFIFVKRHQIAAK